MKRLLMISSSIGLCLAAPAFAQTAPNQDRMNAPRATSPNSSAPAASQSAPRQPQSANQQQPASGGSSSAQVPASSDQSQSATGNQNGQAQNQQQPSSSTSAQAPASSNQSPSATSNQNQRGQAQNRRQPAASGNAATNAQAPANQQQRSSAADQNQPAQKGQAQNRQSQQNMQRQDQSQDARQDRRQDARQDRNANVDRTSVNVNINDTQRTRIASVIRSSNVRPVNVDFRISTGVVVPSRVTLHTLPPDIVSIVPQYRGNRYFVTNDQIVIVEPVKKTIVAVLPASGATARAQAPAATRASFTDEQRQVIRSRASSMRSTTTTGSGPSEIVIEQEVPATIELQEFPAEIVTEVPVVRTYRYFRQDNDVVVVDPAERRVIEIIR
jgi:hypothetical protein